jgi:hypothetical protein
LFPNLEAEAVRRWLSCLLILAGLVAAGGCGREAEKNKFKDLDRPKPAPAKDK